MLRHSLITDAQRYIYDALDIVSGHRTQTYMLFLLALVSALHHNIHAAPTPLAEASRKISIPFTSSDPTSNCACPNTRTIWNIIWTCLVTIVACSWVSVHPNIPAPGKKEWQVALMRLELMIWTIIAPEMMIFWAIRQWIGARRLASLYDDKEHPWTKTHGYFIQMGGFVQYYGSRRGGVLSPERMEELLRKRLIEFPSITEEEIQDRSKGDALSKIIVLGQTSWFIAQCITRRAQGLIMTELELVTLAFAALNSFMYFFWWNKPLDVRTRVPVYVHDAPIPEKESPIDEFSLHDSPVLRITARQDKPAKSARHYWDMVVGFIANILFRWPWQGIVLMFSRLGDMAEFAGRSNIIKEDQERVHPFYAMNTSDKESNRIIGAVSIIGIIFGGIHCAGWEFSFPTHAEAIIWQVTSVIVTGVPIFMVISVLSQSIYFQTETFCLERFFEDVKVVSTTIAIYFGLPIYIIARLVLLTEALIALRNLQPGALLEVQWTSFLPHV
ncbi:hypothetical protein BDN70DRAFT_232064 [Pholiota conissans]|uniref:Uncharacterized protein n=1 Tax=Pholiota conissans TaxID=109636 RepID=A0A9P5YUZ3_9AGAR|nr:hypothetical protein BDN70DRAFT_232064 [Pholiota conissans]